MANYVVKEGFEKLNCNMIQVGTDKKLNPIIGDMKFDIDKHKDYVWDGKEWVEVRPMGAEDKYMVRVLNTEVAFESEKELKDFKEKDIQSIWIRR